MSEIDIKKYIRRIKDFPKKGILFRDITPIVGEKEVFKYTIDTLYSYYQHYTIDKIASTEARGYIFSGALAYKLGCGLVIVRKPGKLPYITIKEKYKLEYGEGELEIHKDSIKQGEKVLVFDDLLATGGTALATCKLVEKLGGIVVGVSFIIELKELKGRELLKKYKVYSLLQE